MVTRVIYPPVWLVFGLFATFFLNEFFPGVRFTSLAGQLAGGLIIVVGLVLLVSAEVLVWSATQIAEALGVSELIIGLTIVAIGTSLPELAVSLVSAMKGEYGLAIGNIVGSNIFNLLAVIGIAAAIDPSALSPTVLSLHIFVMVAFTLVLFAMTYDYDGKADLSRLEGVALLGAYICYFGYVVSQTIQ